MNKPVQLNNSVIKEIEEKRTAIISSLLEFMDYYMSAIKSKSKYGTMGPTGKLLNLCKISGIIDWGKIKGYILNVIRMSGTYSIPLEAVNLIDKVVDDLKEVNEELTGMEWLNFIDGVDYELFFQIFKTNKEGMVEYIRNKFVEYLKQEYKELNKISEILKIPKLEKEEDIPHPSYISNKVVVNAFWENYKKGKEKKVSEK